MNIIAVQKHLSTPEGKALFDMNLSIKNGDLVALYGESGAGKTSILRMIAGLLLPEKGQIIINNETWLDTKKEIDVSPQHRKIGFVFQDYTLFPNMTVKQNLLFALEKGQDKAIVEELIDMTELGELQHRKPSTLSGGQQQRVALARALVRKPALLLLDEPFSALDNKMRAKLQDYILQLHQQYKLTTILVSHNVDEIIKMADYVFVLDKGKVAREGHPKEMLPSSSTLKQFQLEGKIIKVLKEKESYLLSVLIGDNIINVKHSKALKVGDSIKVNLTATSIEIEEI